MERLMDTSAKADADTLPRYLHFSRFLLKIYHQTSNHIFIELKHNRITLFRTNLLKNIIRNLLKSQGISASL